MTWCCEAGVLAPRSCCLHMRGLWEEEPHGELAKFIVKVIVKIVKKINKNEN